MLLRRFAERTTLPERSPSDSSGVLCEKDIIVCLVCFVLTVVVVVVVGGESERVERMGREGYWVGLRPSEVPEHVYIGWQRMSICHLERAEHAPPSWIWTNAGGFQFLMGHDWMADPRDDVERRTRLRRVTEARGKVR